MRSLRWLAILFSLHFCDNNWQQESRHMWLMSRSARCCPDVTQTPSVDAVEKQT